MYGRAYLPGSCSYVYAVRRRIPFASANLATACAAVTDHPQVVYTAFGALVVQVLWVVFWSMAFFGVEANSTDDGYICEFFMLISFFWGLLVIKNIVHCTTAGTVGSWWFVANPQKPVMGAVKRAMTTSLGSICLGSLVVAVLKAMRVMIDSARRGSRRSGGGGAVRRVVIRGGVGAVAHCGFAWRVSPVLAGVRFVPRALRGAHDGVLQPLGVRPGCTVRKGLPHRWWRCHSRVQGTWLDADHQRQPDRPRLDPGLHHGGVCHWPRRRWLGCQHGGRRRMGVCRRLLVVPGPCHGLAVLCVRG